MACYGIPVQKENRSTEETKLRDLEGTYATITVPGPSRVATLKGNYPLPFLTPK